MALLKGLVKVVANWFLHVGLRPGDRYAALSPALAASRRKVGLLHHLKARLFDVWMSEQK